MDVHFLHTGEPVLVIEDGEGEPGGYVVGPNRTQVWTENPDYRPSKVVRLGTVEEVEPGQIAGTSWDDTSTAQRLAAIEAGEHPDREDAQFVPPEPAQPEQPAVPGGSPVVGSRTAAAEAEVPEVPEQTALTDAERTELEQLRADAATRAQDTTTT